MLAQVGFGNASFFAIFQLRFIINESNWWCESPCIIIQIHIKDLDYRGDNKTGAG